MNLQSKKKRIAVLQEKLESFKDDIDLNNNRIPNFYLDSRSINTLPEDRQYELCKNDFIDLRMGAKEGLAHLREALEGRVIKD